MSSSAQIRAFQPGDALSVSTLIRATMLSSNASDYSLSRLQPLMDYFSPARVSQLCEERYCLVAIAGDTVIGTISLENESVASFFVHPEHQGCGIGTQLLERLEQESRKRKIPVLKVESSLAGRAFYARRGFGATGETKEGVAGKHIIFTKELL